MLQIYGTYSLTPIPNGFQYRSFVFEISRFFLGVVKPIAQPPTESRGSLEITKICGEDFVPASSFPRKNPCKIFGPARDQTWFSDVNPVSSPSDHRPPQKFIIYAIYNIKYIFMKRKKNDKNINIFSCKLTIVVCSTFTCRDGIWYT